MQTNITGKHVFYFFVFVALVFTMVKSFDAVEPVEVDRLDVRGEFMANCTEVTTGLQCLCLYESMLASVGEVGIYEIGEAVNNGSLTADHQDTINRAVNVCTK